MEWQGVGEDSRRRYRSPFGQLKLFPEPGLDSQPWFTLQTKHVRIGELARLAGTSVSTVRFYEAQGLMPKPETRDSGYREYENRDLERLGLILAAKRQRFPLG